MSGPKRRSQRASTRLAIRTAIGLTKTPKHVKHDRIVSIILERELDEGGRFIKETVTNKAYFGTLAEIFGLTQPNELTAYLHDEYSLNASSEWMRSVISEFVTKGKRIGDPHVGRRFVAYDTKENVLYMTRWNGRVRKLDGTNITEVPNGREVFFHDDDRGVDCEEPVVGPNGVLLPFLTDLAFQEETIGGMTPEQQKLLLTVWVFAVAFPDLVTSKPILIFEGAPGSGKSTAAILTQAIIHGRKHGMIISKDGEKDFAIQLLRSPIAVFDNVDSFVDWIPDAICAYTTVGEWERRKLYSDDDNYLIKPMSFPVIASKNPASFRREDVADRTIILRLARRDGGFTPLQHLMSTVNQGRPEMFGEFLYYCNQIVAAIRAGVWNQCEEHVSTFRQADFAQFAFLVGAVLGWDPEDVMHALDALTREQKAHASENDDMAQVLATWLVHYKAANGARFMSAREIYAQMEQYMFSASRAKLKFPESALSNRLKMGYFNEQFDIEKDIDRATQQHVYRITGTKVAGLSLDNVIPFPSPTGWGKSDLPTVTITDTKPDTDDETGSS